MSWRSWWRSSVPLLVLGAGACGSNPGDPNGLGLAQVRLLHTAAGAPALDLLIGGRLVAQGIGSAEESPFAGAPAGDQTIALKVSGGGAPVASFRSTLLAGSQYTVLVTGAGTNLTSSVVTDTGSFVPDRANLRVINVPEIRTGPDSSAARPPIPVDVYITAPGAPLDGIAAAFSLDQNISSYSPLLSFDPGTWSVRFATGGTKTVVAESPAMGIAAGQVRAVTLYRTAGSGWAVSVVSER